MKFAQLNNPFFQSALNHLLNQPMPVRSAIKVKNIVTNIQQQIERFDEHRKHLLELYGAKNDAGELLLNEDGSVHFDSEEQLGSLAKALNELNERTVNVGTITVAELGDIKLSVEDVIALSDIIVE